jgi:hypothetical protein
MLPQQDRRRRGHRLEIQRPENTPAIRAVERIGITQMHAVFVALARRLKARMKSRRDLARRFDLNRLRQADLQRRQQFLRAMLPRRVEMKHLPQRMHSGIGASAATDAHRPAKNLGQPALNHILHGIVARLALPAGKPGAVVGTDTPPAGRILSCCFQCRTRINPFHRRVHPRNARPAGKANG